MNKYHFIVAALGLLVAEPTYAASASFINSTRLLEDSLWAIAFVMMSMFGYVAAKAMESSRAIHGAYLVLFASGIFGFFWKIIGVYMRITGVKEPKWFFEVTRESLEMIASYLFLLAFVVLFFKLKK